MEKSSAEKRPLTPAALAQKAAGMPWKGNARIDLFPYEKAIVALRERGYSYAEVAAWLAKELNAPVQRGQVYYVCQARAAENQQAFEEAERKGKVRTLPNISPEEAERAALQQDGEREKARTKPKKKT